MLGNNTEFSNFYMSRSYWWALSHFAVEPNFDLAGINALLLNKFRENTYDSSFNRKPRSVPSRLSLYMMHERISERTIDQKPLSVSCGGVLL